MDIHERLREERERLGLSQTEVSSRLAVGKNTYLRYESGETSPTARHLAELDRMGMDVYYIVVGERTGNELGAEYGNLISAYSKCSEELRGAALAVLMSSRLKEVDAAKVVPRFFEEKFGGVVYPSTPPAPLVLHDSPAERGAAPGQLPGERGAPKKKVPHKSGTR